MGGGRQDLRDVFQRQATDGRDGCWCVRYEAQLFCLERVELFEMCVTLLWIVVVVVCHGVDYGECRECTAGYRGPGDGGRGEGEGEKADQARSAAGEEARIGCTRLLPFQICPTSLRNHLNRLPPRRRLSHHPEVSQPPSPAARHRRAQHVSRTCPPAVESRIARCHGRHIHRKVLRTVGA